MEVDKTGVHLSHCYQGEEWGWCKYGDEDCPARAVAREHVFMVTVTNEDDEIVSETSISVLTASDDPGLLEYLALNEAASQRQGNTY